MKINFIKQFNRIMADPKNQSLIQKALTSAAGSGEALIPQDLEKVITNACILLSPEIALLSGNMKKITGNKHEFNRYTQRPGRGGAMGETSTTPVTSSKFVRDDVKVKIVKRKGRVTNFLQETSEDYIDAAGQEMENHIQAQVLAIIFYILFGNLGANAYEFGGLETNLSSNRVAFDAAAGGAVPTKLDFLDEMIDKSTRAGGNKHQRVFLCSPEMLSKVSNLLTNVRLNQGLSGSGLTQVDVAGGWRLNAYRDIPIVETTALKPVEKMTPTVTCTPSITDGTLVADDYFVYVSPVTYEGEQEPCDVKTATVASGSTGSISIALNEPHYSLDAEGGHYYSVMQYKIYIGTTTGHANAKLVKVVSAFTYDSDGSPDGDNGVDEAIVITSLTPGADVPTHMADDIPFAATGGVYSESLVLWDLDPIQGMGKLVYANKPGDRFQGLIVTEPLAKLDDYIEFLMRSYCALVPSFQKSSYWLRNIRVK